MSDIFQNNLLVMLQTYLNNTKDYVFYKDVNLVYMAASLPFAKMVSLNDPKDIVGKTDFDIFPHDLAERYIEDDRAVFKSGKPIIDRLEPLPDKDDLKRFTNTSKYLVRNEQGEVIGLYGVSQDVTGQIEMLEENERGALSQNMYDDVWNADLTLNKMLHAENQNFEFPENCSFTDAVLLLSKYYIHPNYANYFADRYNIDTLTAQFEQGNKEFTHITYKKDLKGNYKWIEFQTKLYLSQVSNTLRISSFLSDQDERIRTQQQLKQKAETDSLTGLLNHKSIVTYITKTLTGFEKHMKHALMFIDMDGFKNVNDNFGHPYGDDVLKRVTERLNSICTESHLVGRIGGDEFLIFMKNVHSKDSVERFARTVLDVVKTECDNENLKLSVTCSVGIALYLDESMTFETLYHHADEAMYKAKALGKNRFAFFD